MSRAISCGFVERKRTAPDALRQVFAGDQLEHEEAASLGALESIDGRDAGVIQRREQTRFALEAPQSFGIVGEGVGENLDGDVAAQARVAGAIHLAHAACADLLDDFVASEFAGDHGAAIIAELRRDATSDSAHCRDGNRALY